MVLQLIDERDALLRQQLDEYVFDSIENSVKLANDLIETMTHHRALGLSANQCGLPHRVFVMHSSPTKVCFNPRIVTVSNEQITLDEGCLSFPNFFVKIKRPQKIKVRFQDAYGETYTEQFVGMTARIFLHEMDHMEGKIFTSRANRIHLNRAEREQKMIARKMKLLEKYKEMIG